MLLILILSISSVASAEILDDTETILACGMAESGNCGVTFLLLFILIVSAVALIKLDAYWKRNGKR